MSADIRQLRNRAHPRRGDGRETVPQIDPQHHVAVGVWPGETRRGPARDKSLRRAMRWDAIEYLPEYPALDLA
jgi:hypothetical protein